MSDSWIEKTEDEIRDEVFSWGKEETGLTNLKSVGVFRGFLEVLVLTAVKAYTGYINPIYKQANLDSATGLWLSLWGLLVGVTRKKAVKAAGSSPEPPTTTGSCRRAPGSSPTAPRSASR
jgi:hypothetical protein